jgi:hypothetical protein
MEANKAFSAVIAPCDLRMSSMLSRARIRARYVVSVLAFPSLSRGRMTDEALK